MQPILLAATAQAGKSRQFYESLLGLEFVSDQPHALVFVVAGVEFRIQKVEQVVSVPYTTVGFKTDDIQTEVIALRDKGLVFETYAFLEQDELGIWTTPDGAQIAWCRDPDGNVVSLTQHPTQGQHQE